MILVPEDYDYYTIHVPYPIQTMRSKDEILEDIERFYNSFIPFRDDSHENTRVWMRHLAGGNDRDTTHRVSGSNAFLSVVQLEQSEHRGPSKPILFSFLRPTVLTIDEWFAYCPPENEV